jgi:hypothetical protein
VISSAQKRKLLGVAVILLAMALFGLAAKAKTSHYSPASDSSAYFSSSVKLSYKAPTLLTLLPPLLVSSPGLAPEVATFNLPLVLIPVIALASEPRAGIKPLRAPPAFSSPLS